MPTLRQEIRPNTDLTKRILNGCQRRVEYYVRKSSDLRNKWGVAEDAVLAYIPETETDSARRRERDNEGIPKYTTIKIPYSYAVVMASHTYWTTTFLSRSPVLQFSGRHGESQQQEQAMEALIAYQTDIGRHLAPIYSWLFDVGRYGCGVMGCYWAQDVHHVSDIEDIPILGPDGVPVEGKTKRQQTTYSVQGYQGNKLYNIRPQEFGWDPRHTLRDFQSGEFCFVRRRLPWNEIVVREAQGFYTNKDLIKNNVSEEFKEVYDDSSLRTPQTMDRDQRDFRTRGEGSGRSDSDFSQNDKKRPEVVPSYEMYVSIIPEEWKLSGSSYPEKWVFTVTADFDVVLGAQPLGLIHGKYPFLTCEMEPDAYSVINRGVPEILTDVQNTLDWLVNSHFYNVRAALNNQYVVDPSRIVMKDILDPTPGGIIRLKESGYGQDVRNALMQMPVTDVTHTHLNDLASVFAIGERAIGVNDQLLGVLATGGRKTATEVRSSNSAGLSRLKTNTEYMSATGFTDLSQMLVQQSQQFYDQEDMFKIVGSLLQDAGPRFVQVTPDMISGFYDYVPVDGSLPIDRNGQVMIWKDIMSQLFQIPQIAQRYDIARIFAWVAQLAGIRNINQFQLQAQVVPDEQLQQEAQAGNVVPMRGRVDSQGAPTPRQVSGLGEMPV